VPVCDGCGLSVDAQHIRQRIQRLELATRFRPVHISVLVLDAAPPAQLEDFFYAAANREGSPPVRSAYFDELSRLAPVPDGSPETMLAEFQRRGLFLASAVECPISSDEQLVGGVRRLAPTVVRRVQTSYKPKFVALISRATAELIEPFRAAGWGDHLVLDHGEPFASLTEAGRSLVAEAFSAAISRLT
jgi:hypothetical protein